MATEQAPTQTPEATTTPADAANDGPPVIPERDYGKLLVTDDGGDDDDAPAQPEAETPAVVADEQVEETPAAPTETPEPEAKEPEAAAPAVATPETPKPGTPDKALQKIQQDLAAATREIASLREKSDAGERLTPREVEKQVAAERKLDAVRAALKAKGRAFDVLEDGMGEAIAETLDEQDRTAEELRQENLALKQRVERIEQATAAQQRDAQWRETEQQYPGVNVRGVWDKAAADAIEASGFSADEVGADPKLARAIQNVASRTFHERAAAAKTRTQTKEPPAPPADRKPPATRTVPPVTPNGARVAQSSGVTPASDPDDYSRYRHNARALVQTD